MYEGLVDEGGGEGTVNEEQQKQTNQMILHMATYISPPSSRIPASFQCGSRQGHCMTLDGQSVITRYGIRVAVMATPTHTHTHTHTHNS